MMARRRTRPPLPVPEFTVAEALRTLQSLPPLDDLHHLATARVDEQFLVEVRAAHRWATTWPGRWRCLPHESIYNLRHYAAADTKCLTMTDASFTVGAMLAGWTPAQKYNPANWCPTVVGLKRAPAP